MATPDPFQQAFHKAKADFLNGLAGSKTNIQQDILSTTNIDQVYDTIDKLQLDHAKRGRNRNIARIQPFLEGLQSYTQAIEVFIQVKPEVLALIWGPIKLLLLWTTNTKQALDAVLNTAATIGELLPKFQRVKEIFCDDDRLKSILGLFYVDVLDFYSVSLDFFSKSRFEVFFESLWPRCRERIRVVEGFLDRHAQLLRDEVTFEHIRLEHQGRADALASFQKIQKVQLRQSFGILQTAISPRLYHDKQDWLRSRACRDTAEWLTKEDDFKKWLDISVSPEKKILWLQGIPGAGNTFLASWIIDKVRETSHTPLYVFCSHLYADTKAISVIHSLLFQLASEDENLQAFLTESSRRDFGSNTKAASDVLKTAVQAAGLTFIAIDGLDEIEEFERNQVLYHLLDILKACPSARLCLSSRIEDGIDKIIGDHSSRIRVDAKNYRSIQSYVNARFEGWMQECGFGTELKDEIEGLVYSVAAQAKGMFLYARIVFDNVKLLTDPDEIRSELKVLPRDLDAAYDQIFSRLNDFKPPQREKARKILGWIACAPAPMTTLELDQALLVRRGMEDVPVVRASTAIVQLCGPIVEIVNKTPQFVHFTVKEYIFSPQVMNFISLPDSVNQLLETCCAYLCSKTFDEEKGWHDNDTIKSAIITGRFRLLGFATSNWLPLVMKSLHMSHDTAHLEVVVALIQELADERRNGDYTERKKDMQDPGFKLLLGDWPESCRFLAQAFSFYKHGRQDEWTIDNAKKWTKRDPLVLSQLHAQVDQLRLEMPCHNKNHEKDCHCTSLLSHYGERIFPCILFSCPFRRIGFASYSDFRDHVKRHSRPHKCWEAGCEHTQIGFLTKAARSSHWVECHEKAKTKLAGHSAVPKGGIDELYPLLLEMIKSEDVDGVRQLWLACEAQAKSWVKVEMAKAAAVAGSLPITRIILGSSVTSNGRPFWSLYGVSDFVPIVQAAVTGENAEVLRYCFSAVIRHSLQDNWKLRDYGRIVTVVMRSTSLEVSSAWQESVLQLTSPLDPDLLEGLMARPVLNAAEGNPMQEIRLLQTWRELHARGEFTEVQLGNLFVTIARSSCSIRQAEMLLEAGVSVDYRMHDAWRPPERRRGGFTALHRAAKKTGEKAAHFMKFLLLKGADPTLGYNHVYPRDEVGAREIQR